MSTWSVSTIFPDYAAECDVQMLGLSMLNLILVLRLPVSQIFGCMSHKTKVGWLGSGSILRFFARGYSDLVQLNL